MKKIFPLSFVLALLLIWSIAWADDGRRALQEQEIQEKLAAEQERQAQLRSLTVAVKPVDADRLQAVPGIKTVYKGEVTYTPWKMPVVLTDYLYDDFEDGDFTNNPTWTAVSNGNGNGAEDWAIRADPWTYAWGTVENHGTGYFVGSDSDGGGALADEEISVDFPTPGGGGDLTLYYWLHFRAYNGDTEYFRVLVDGQVVDSVQAESGFNPPPIEGVRTVILDAFNDGATHTLTMHYYADWGYVAAFDDVVITDDPRQECELDCPPGGFAEGEPDCSDFYPGDEYNVGCNGPPFVFTDIACGDTVCGLSGVFLGIDPESGDTVIYRDTDWYRLELTEPGDLEWGGTAEFPLLLFIIDAGSENCEDYEILLSGVTDNPCDTVRITERLLPGVYYLWAGPRQWYQDLWCDGTGPLGNEYVAWVTCTPTPPCNPEVVIGDINSQLPYSDLGQTTCGKGNDWDNTCLGFWDGGEDIVYEFTVSEMVVLDITLDPHDTPWTGIAIDDFCPLDESECLAFAWQTSTPSPYGIEGFIALPGTYWIMIDTWPSPDCIPEFDLRIREGELAVALAQTANIPDCGVSNFGPLGETDTQGNTYSWSGNPPANFAGTFVMGNSPTTMFSYYNPGVTDCYEYRGILGVDISDPFHPTSIYDDNMVLDSVTIEYCGDGFTAPPEAGDIFVHSFTITNHASQTLTDYYAGVYFDWDVAYPDADTVVIDRSNNLIYQGYPDYSYIMGLCLINAGEVPLSSLVGVSQMDYIYPSGPSGGGWRMDHLYGLMSAGVDSIADSFYVDMSALMSTGPYTLDPGQSVTIQIAVIGASNEADMIARAQYAATLDIPICDVQIGVGACCDDETGICEDNILETECDGTRFVENTLCADLDPQCGETGGCDYICGDVNGNGVVNVVDITALVLYLTAGNLPGCPCDCLTPPFYACADVNGNCGINVVDITALVLYLTAGQPPSTCVDCPSTNPCPPALTLPEGGGPPTLITPNKVKTIRGN